MYTDILIRVDCYEHNGVVDTVFKQQFSLNIVNIILMEFGEGKIYRNFYLFQVTTTV